MRRYSLPTSPLGRDGIAWILIQRVLSFPRSDISPMRIARFSLAALSFVALDAVALGQDLLWDLQLGTASDDDVGGVAADGSGGVYLTGSTWGGLGAPNAGFNDPWLARYDSSGNQVWIRQFGFGFNWVEGSDFAASDGVGGVYVGGSRCDALCSATQAWYARYDDAGNELWNRFVFGAGSVLAAAPDLLDGVYAGGGTDTSLGAPNAGMTDVWFARYDTLGNELWLRQFGTSERDILFGATPDSSGGVYLCGQLGKTGGPVGHAWFARYDSAGSQMWMRELSMGNALTSASGICPDGSGGVYVCGLTTISLGGQPLVGGSDAFVTRYDDAGNEIWTRILGTTSGDQADSVALSDAGGVFVTGDSTTNTGGNFHEDVWLAHYDSAGNLSWTETLATNLDEVPGGVASDGSGGVYVGGSTRGSLAGPSAGLSDAWLARYATDGPSTYCTAKANSLGCTPQIASSGCPSETDPNPFDITASMVLNQRNGLLFYGYSLLAGTPFQGGTLCVSPPLRRTMIQSAGGTLPPANDCSGQYSFDFNARIQSGIDPLLISGQQVGAQYWSRDPAIGDGTGAGITDGVEFVIMN